MEQLLVEPWQRVSISTSATTPGRCHANGSGQEYQVSQGKYVPLDVTLIVQGKSIKCHKVNMSRISL